MTALDVTMIAAAVFVSGWFIIGFIRLETEGNKWPLIQRFLFTAFVYAGIVLTSLCFSWWYNYHHALPWQEFIVCPCIASAAAAIQVYQKKRRERFHIPTQRKQRR